MLAAVPCMALGSIVHSQGARLPLKRIGVLFQGTQADDMSWWDKDFTEPMRARQWHPGRDYVLVRAYGDWRLDRLDAAVAELIKQKVDLIVLYTPDDVTMAVASATKTVPIVFNQAYAPLELGLIDSYARPGRNLTGTTIFSGPEVIAKRLEYLRALAPQATRLFWLYGSGSPLMRTLGGGTFDAGELIRRTADSLGMTARIHVVHDPSEVEAALTAASTWGAHAISAGGSPVYVEKERVIDFATKARVPTVFSVRDYVRAGGLMSYGVPSAEYDALTDRWVAQIDKVLRGTPPAVIPVEIPIRFELCINAKVAKHLGVTIPLALRSRADEIIGG